MPAVVPSDQSTGIYSQQGSFWENYLKGRPRAPDKFFDRIFRYHQDHGGKFGTVHDIGAGIAPYATMLRSKFQHVILSDVSSENVALAQKRLGKDGFSYRVAKAEDVDDIPPASVDMAFASTMFHFCDQKPAMNAMAKQLRPGGTFVCFFVGGAWFYDPTVRDLYARIVRTGNRALWEKVSDPDKLLYVFERVRGLYNVAPLDDEHWLPGAQRVHLNTGETGFPSMVPSGANMEVEEPLYTGPNDVESFLTEDGWEFEMGIDDIKEHVRTMTFKDSPELNKLEQELANIVGTKKFNGCWPCNLILATRR